MNELRKDRRAPASLKVKYKSATVDDFIEQFGADVSRGGIFIKTKKPLETGALLKFEFQLQGGVAVIHGVGRVAWRRPEDKARADIPAGMGIKFIKLDDQSRAVIERIEGRHGVGSRFDQTEAAEFAPPLSSLPPNPARSGIATPPAPAAAPASHAGEPEPVPMDHPTFRPPPPAISSIPPALADAWPASASAKPAERSGPLAAAQPVPQAVPQSVPKGALGSFFPNGGPRKSAPSVRSSTARDTSEFLASAFSVGGAGHDVRSQARVQVERARHDPQSVDLANELFGDLSEPTHNTKPPPSAASGLPPLDTGSEAKTATPQERSLAEKIPSIEELVDEDTSSDSAPSFQRNSGASAPAGLASALSSLPPTSTVPLSLALSDRPARPHSIESNLETLRPTPASPNRRSVSIMVGAILFVAVAALTFFLVRRPQHAPSAAPATTVPSAATATAPTVNEPSDKAAAPSEPSAPAKPVPIDVNVTSEPRGAQVLVDGKPAGTTPVTLALKTTIPAEISVRSPGYAPKSQRVTPEVGMAPQHVELAPLPYELVINTTPPGATVRAKDVSAVSPAPLVLGHLDGMISVTVEKDGHQRTSRTVRLEEFHEQNGTMRAVVTLSLSPLPNALRRKPAARSLVEPPPEPPGVAPPVVLVKPESGSDEPAKENKAAAPAAAPDALPNKPEPAPVAPGEPPAAPPTTP
jgi:uncharacterized protein (TIGR02266 family)